MSAPSPGFLARHLAAAESDPLPRWSYQVYNCFTLLLSCIVLCAVCLMHEMSRNASVLPHAFRMLRLRRRRLYCFEVDISSGASARKVRMQYTWVLRTTLLVVGCYVWQTCVLTFWAMDMRTDTMAKQKLVAACGARRADCFGVSHNYEFFSINATPDNLCSKFPNMAQLFSPEPRQFAGRLAGGNRGADNAAEQMELHKLARQMQSNEPFDEETFLTNYRFVTCVAFAKPDTITVTQHLCIAFALANMIVTLFEVLVWLLYRARISWLPLLVLVVGILFLGIWIGSIFIPKLLTFFSSWIGYVMLLSTPVILWTAVLAAHNLRKIQHQKLELWKKQLNRPMAESDDPAVGAAVANAAGAPLMYSASIGTPAPGMRYQDKLGGARSYLPANILAGGNPFSKFSLGRPALGPFLGRFQPLRPHRRFAGGVGKTGGATSRQVYAGTELSSLPKVASSSFSVAANSTVIGEPRTTFLAPHPYADATQQQLKQQNMRTPQSILLRTGRPSTVAGLADSEKVVGEETVPGLATVWEGSSTPEAPNDDKSAALSGASATTAPAATTGGGTASTAGGSAGRASPLSNGGNVSNGQVK